MINLEGLDNLKVIEFFKKNIKSLVILLLSAFVFGFIIGYLFSPFEKVVSIQGIPIDIDISDKAKIK